MLWSALTFGKYKGKSLPQVVLHDPDYFFWCCEKGVFDRDGFVEQAYILEGRACNLKIPKSKPEDWCTLYHTDRNGHFAGFDIVEVAEAPQLDSVDMWREDRLDFSVVRRLKSYDKLGGKILLRAFKHHFFGSENIRLTKQRCEEFFSKESNFILTPGKPCKRSGNPFAEDNEPSTWAELLAENRMRQETKPKRDPLVRSDLGCSEAEISDEEWLAQVKQEEEYYRAEEKKSLERAAQYSWGASERLRVLLEKEEEQKALAAWAEQDRRRQEAIAEASSFSWLFDAS
jgi:hypothetical protein